MNPHSRHAPDSSSGALSTPIAATLCYAVAMMIVGQSFLFTILPPLGREIGLAEFQIGMIMSVHGLFMLFTGPIAGGLSESWGRRRILVIGTSLYATSVLAFGMVITAAIDHVFAASTTIILLVMSRAVYAAGAGAVMPGAMALAADLSSREHRMKAMSLLAAAMSTGAIIGPSTAALFAGLGFAAPFYMISAFAFLGALASRLVLPETRAPRSVGAGFVWRHMFTGRIGAIVLSNACFMVGCYGTFSILGFHVQDRFDLEPTKAAQMMGVGLVLSAFANVSVQAFIIRRFRLTPRVLLMCGVPITVLAFLLVAQTSNVWAFGIYMALNGLGQGLVTPAFQTALSLSVGSGDQGRIAGVSSSIQAFAFLVGPFSAATTYQIAPLLVFIVGPTVIALSLIPFLVAARTSMRPTEPN